MRKFSVDILHKNLEYLASRSELHLDIPEVVQGHRQLTVLELMEIARSRSISLENLLYRDMEQQQRLRQAGIKMLVMDCDGVLTDGGMYFTESGDEIKRFNAKDGQGIKKLHEQGMLTGIISAGINKKIIEHRAQMLGIPHVYVGKEPKLNILQNWLQKLGLDLKQIAYIGDDLTDLPVLQAVGFSACPADAATDVLATADLVLTRNGGDGCVRELAEEYLLA